MNTIDNILNIMKKYNVNKAEMWKPVCEAWYSVTSNVVEELNNSMQRRITDLIKEKGGTKKYRLYVGVHCCCVFIGMYLKYVVVFFIGIYLILIYNCCLIIR